jgi:hypothetical protein
MDWHSEGRCSVPSDGWVFTAQGLFVSYCIVAWCTSEPDFLCSSLIRSDKQLCSSCFCSSVEQPSFLSRYFSSCIHVCAYRNILHIGQTGRNVKDRFQEHIHDIKKNEDDSKYAAHILSNKHSYGKGKLIPLHAMEALGVSGGIAPTHS